MYFDGVVDSSTDPIAQSTPQVSVHTEQGIPASKQRFKASVEEEDLSPAYQDSEGSDTIGPMQSSQHENAFMESATGDVPYEERGRQRHRSTSRRRYHSPQDLPYRILSRAIHKDTPEWECDYEVDSQFPSPPKVTYSRPAEPVVMSREAPSFRKSSSDEALEEDEGSTGSYDWQDDPPTALTSPSIQYDEQRSGNDQATALSPEDPGHPDHFVYLMSSGQIVPSEDPNFYRCTARYKNPTKLELTEPNMPALLYFEQNHRSVPTSGMSPEDLGHPDRLWYLLSSRQIERTGDPNVYRCTERYTRPRKRQPHRVYDTPSPAPRQSYKIMRRDEHIEAPPSFHTDDIPHQAANNPAYAADAGEFLTLAPEDMNAHYEALGRAWMNSEERQKELAAEARMGAMRGPRLPFSYKHPR